MNKCIHPSPDDIAGILSGTLNSRKRDRIESHLKRCAECTRMLTFLESMSSRQKDALNDPPADLRQRVLQSAGMILSGRENVSCGRVWRSLLRPAYAYWMAGFAATGVITALIISMLFSSGDEPIPLELSVIRGTISVNGNPCDKTALKKDDKLKSNDGSFAVLRQGDFLTISLVNNCELTVGNTARRNGSRFPMIDLTLNYGSMFVATDHTKGHLIINAAGIAIKPVGTEFAVYSLENTVHMIVLKGSISAVQTASPREEVVHENQSYSTNKTPLVGPASKDDLAHAAALKSGFILIHNPLINPNRKSRTSMKSPAASENAAQRSDSSMNGETPETEPVEEKTFRKRNNIGNREADSMRREIQRSRRGEYRQRR